MFRRILTSLSLEDNPKPIEKTSLEDTSVLSPKDILAWRAKRQRIENASTSSSVGISKDPQAAKASSNPSVALAPPLAPATELGVSLSGLPVSVLPPIPSDADYYIEALKVELIVWLFPFSKLIFLSKHDNNVLPLLGSVFQPSETL